ncbi:MAG: hypothetical protein J7L08_02550 [Candidatus Aenigmarchaeota archaeon]|nr:hypothetical protein [Candidatus Aenigmarchaeota archaeon]
MTQVADIYDMSELYDYTYTTVTNSTKLTLNNSVEKTHTLSIGSFADTIENEDIVKTLVININNTGASSYNLTVKLNGKSLETFVIPKGEKTKTYSDVAWVESATNNITYSSDTTSNDVDVISSVGKYPSGRTTVGFGSVYDSLTTNTSTIYDVMVLVIIVVALGIAIGSIRGFSGKKESNVAI